MCRAQLFAAYTSCELLSLGLVCATNILSRVVAGDEIYGESEPLHATGVPIPYFQ